VDAEAASGRSAVTEAWETVLRRPRPAIRRAPEGFGLAQRGRHASAKRCPSAIWAGVIRPRTRSRLGKALALP